ncbi:response regulator transcription factor [Lishizhenia sp.]|uniref:LytR/AlgR family response regulator transcription factor n=1 Tax=Lishizhenia sp. TaxID=2497594 RepID=UPI00299E2F49|nr:response regulator transcription factor [Lishizhenia sp.]MDX1445324.1 response regulator transcription factor [Lishizhenia sp.]
MKKERIFIVEDDVIAQEVLKDFIEEFGYDVIGVTGDPQVALNTIELERPDLVVLDINLRSAKLNGIDIASKIDVPFIYLTANSDKFTLREAAQTSYVDFVLKPIDSERLKVAISLALQKTFTHEEEPKEACLVLKNSNTIIRTPYKQILFIKSLGNYIEVHEKMGRKLIRKTLKEVEGLLPEEHFLKTHRSYVVNKEYIEKVSASNIVLAGVKIPVSRSFKEAVRQALDVA